MRNVVLEEFTLKLASEYSILFGTGHIDYHDDDDEATFKRTVSNPESVINTIIVPPKSRLSALERFSDLETDPLLVTHSNSPIPSASSQQKHSHSATSPIVDKGKGRLQKDDNNIEQQPARRLLTISRSIKLPLVTINTQEGILGSKLILEETKSKIYKQIQYSSILLLAIIMFSGMVFSHIENWTFLNGKLTINP
jgi:hypothetical protein